MASPAADMGFLNPGYKFTFVIGLPEFEIKIGGLSCIPTTLFDVCQRLPAVDTWLAFAKQVEVGAVQDPDGRARCHVFSSQSCKSCAGYHDPAIQGNEPHRRNDCLATKKDASIWPGFDYNAPPLG